MTAPHRAVGHGVSFSSAPSAGGLPDPVRESPVSPAPPQPGLPPGVPGFVSRKLRLQGRPEPFESPEKPTESSEKPTESSGGRGRAATEAHPTPARGPEGKVCTPWGPRKSPPSWLGSPAVCVPPGEPQAALCPHAATTSQAQVTPLCESHS